MKALSLTQPWASLVANGSKRIETRSWRTSHRGLIAIHASKGFPAWAKELCGEEPFYSALIKYNGSRASFGGIATQIVAVEALPRGTIIATAELVACSPTNTIWGVTDAFRQPREGEPEHAFGDYSDGRYMWFLENVHPLPEPIPCRGALGLWEIPTEIEAVIQPSL